MNFANLTNLDFRLLIGAAKFSLAYNKTLSLTTFVDGPPEIVASICKVEYSMGKANVFFTQETGEFSFTHKDTSESSKHLNGLTPTQLTELLFSLTCEEAGDGTGNMPNAYQIFGSDFSGLPVMYLMNQWNEKYGSGSSLSDQQTFLSAFSQT